MLGSLQINGTYNQIRGMINYTFAPGGLMSFHSPSEHTINGFHSDVEVAVEFINDETQKKAFVSFLFNGTNGGNNAS